ncbi:GGDEF domain-containing protein [Ideonella sp. A 288]|uniref:GGDEF domain-containing protein n=1 Tax=Ideonella sp. A 288 TaxID=1962181 RepID=UPI000B4BB8E2|nr:GGDEF domain-containing protein [Ideonella sp. A 288]
MKTTRGQRSLQRLLTIPFVGLVIGLAMTLGALSYSAGSSAVDTLSARLLEETVQRIGQAIERHVVGSGAVLEAAFPNGVPAASDLRQEVGPLRTRFWIATSLHRDPNNYVYYGNRSGQFMGLWRHSADEAELRLKFEADAPRSIQHFKGIAGELQPPLREARVFDPRHRPWYLAGVNSDLQTWTSIYVDFRTLELVATRARRVMGPTGVIEGVVATDVSLLALDNFVRRLKVSANGIAFIVEPNGQLIAASNAPNLRRKADGSADRVAALGSGEPLLEATYLKLRDRLSDSSLAKPGSLSFTGPDGRTIETGYARVVDSAGLDWSVVVALPRDDFMAGVSANVTRTALSGAIAALAVAVIGLWIVRWVTDDVRRLSDATQRIGDGDLDTPMGAQRTKELGMLADSFQRMQIKLRTDRLTGLANREGVMQRLTERTHHSRRVADERALAVLFVDLDRFKSINDSFGHEAGDRVLSMLGLRLRQGVRDTDLVARWAGDEFVVLLDGIDSVDGAEQIRTQLEHRLREPLDIAPAHLMVVVGGTIGLAIYPRDGADADALIEAADRDMYARKPTASAPQG